MRLTISSGESSTTQRRSSIAVAAWGTTNGIVLVPGPEEARP